MCQFNAVNPAACIFVPPPPSPSNDATETSFYNLVAATMRGGSVGDVYLGCGGFDCVYRGCNGQIRYPAGTRGQFLQYRHSIHPIALPTQQFRPWCPPQHLGGVLVMCFGVLGGWNVSSEVGAVELGYQRVWQCRLRYHHRIHQIAAPIEQYILLWLFQRVGGVLVMHISYCGGSNALNWVVKVTFEHRALVQLNNQL